MTPLGLGSGLEVRETQFSHVKVLIKTFDLILNMAIVGG